MSTTCLITPSGGAVGVGGGVGGTVGFAVGGFVGFPVGGAVGGVDGGLVVCGRPGGFVGGAFVTGAARALGDGPWPELAPPPQAERVAARTRADSARPQRLMIFHTGAHSGRILTAYESAGQYSGIEWDRRITMACKTALEPSVPRTITGRVGVSSTLRLSAKAFDASTTSTRPVRRMR